MNGGEVTSVPIDVLYCKEYSIQYNEYLFKLAIVFENTIQYKIV